MSFFKLGFKAKLSNRLTESGNVFMMLFGAVAMVGVLGAATMTVMKGPVKTMSEVTKRTVAENNMIAAGKLALIAAAAQANNDCDSDLYVEPIPFGASVAGFTGGGELPSTIGVAKQDPWGGTYVYCAWDHGPTIDDAACGGASQNRLQGTNADTEYTLAIISAGPDGVYNTTCNDYSGAGTTVVKTPGTDDIVLGYTYAEAGAMSGGLWNLADPDTAEIAKDLSIKDSSNVEQFAFDANAGNLQIGGTGNFPKVGTDNLQAFAGAGGTVNVLSALSSIENITTTKDVSAVNVTASGNITATGNVSGADLAASGTLDVTGISTLAQTDTTTLSSSGAATLNSLGVTNNATVGGTLGVTGATSLSTLGTSGLATLDSTAVTNNATIGGTLGVTGATTLSTLTTSSTASIGGNLDMNLNKITNMADPTLAQDAATKAYVDTNIAAGTGYTETDPQVNTLTAGKFCVTNAGGTAIDCTTDTPSGSDNLGNHTATQDLDMAANDIINIDNTIFNGIAGALPVSGSGGGSGGVDWVKFSLSGTTVNIDRKSSGIASVTRLGTGRYRVNFVSTKSSADYGVAVTPKTDQDATVDATTTTYADVGIWNNDAYARQEASSVYVIITDGSGGGGGDNLGNHTATTDLLIGANNIKFGASNLQGLRGNDAQAAIYNSNHSTDTQLQLRDKEDAVYGSLFGNGDGTNFGLLDGDGDWAILHVKNASTQFRINNTTEMILYPTYLNMYDKKITRVNNPTGAQDVATKNYVDTAVSDRRLKKNIKDMKNHGLDTIMALRPVTYEWKKPTDEVTSGKQFGFIAQEVAETIPELSIVKNDEMKTMTYKHRELVSILVKAVQELKNSNDAIKADNEALKTRIEALEAK